MDSWLCLQRPQILRANSGKENGFLSNTWLRILAEDLLEKKSYQIFKESTSAGWEFNCTTRKFSSLFAIFTNWRNAWDERHVFRCQSKFVQICFYSFCFPMETWFWYIIYAFNFLFFCDVSTQISCLWRRLGLQKDVHCQKIVSKSSKLEFSAHSVLDIISRSSPELILQLLEKLSYENKASHIPLIADRFVMKMGFFFWIFEHGIEQIAFYFKSERLMLRTPNLG